MFKLEISSRSQLFPFLKATSVFNQAALQFPKLAKTDLKAEFKSPAKRQPLLEHTDERQSRFSIVCDLFLAVG